MPVPADIIFPVGVDAATLDITIVPEAGVNGDKRFTVGFTAATVGFPSTPNVMEITVLEVGKSYNRLVTLESMKTFTVTILCKLVNLIGIMPLFSKLHAVNPLSL